MACKIIRSRGAVFSVWGVPELPDIDLVLSELHAAAREFGGKVTYVTRVPAGAPAPTSIVRERFDAAMPEVVALCSTYHVVLEGQGFVAAFKRAVLTSFLQPFWKQRVFFVHADCRDVTPKLATDERPLVTELIERARSRGLIGAALEPSPSF